MKKLLIGLTLLMCLSVAQADRDDWGGGGNHNGWGGGWNGEHHHHNGWNNGYSQQYYYQRPYYSPQVIVPQCDPYYGCQQQYYQQPYYQQPYYRQQFGISVPGFYFNFRN